MPLSLPVSRSLRHTRAITVEAYARDDGLWDLDASIRDVKTRDIPLASGTRPGGTPVHDLKLRVTIDRNLTIVDAEAASDAVPYPGFCETIVPAYKKLVGLSRLIGQVDAMVRESGEAPVGFDAARWFAAWMGEPVAALGGLRPQQLLDTADGREALATLLLQMRSGVYA